MLGNNPFYHKVFKRTIIAFGSMFSDVTIERKDADGGNAQTIKVPIAQAPKEKWIVRLDSDAGLENHTYTTLPRMSFEITGVNYDASRKFNRLNKIACFGDSADAQFAYAPVPYNIEISLYILTKTQEDAFQIVEQILPYFTPEFTLRVKNLDEMNVVTDIPIILNNVSFADDYDGDFQTRRFITWTLNFTLKVNMFGAVNSGGLITTSGISLGSDLLNSAIVEEFHDLSINPETQQVIVNQWNNLHYPYANPINPQPIPEDPPTEE